MRLASWFMATVICFAVAGCLTETPPEETESQAVSVGPDAVLVAPEPVSVAPDPVEGVDCGSPEAGWVYCCGYCTVPEVCRFIMCDQ